MPAWTGYDVQLDIGATRKRSCGKTYGGIGTDSIVLVADPQADGLMRQARGVDLLGRNIQAGELVQRSKVGQRSKPGCACDTGVRSSKTKGAEGAA